MSLRSGGQDIYASKYYNAILQQRHSQKSSLQTLMRNHIKGNTLNVSDPMVKREGHCRKRKFSWEWPMVLCGKETE